MGNGFSHVGVSTHDMDATIRFYETILGFPRIAENLTRVIEGGTLRQVNFDLGDGQYIVFMEPKGVRGIAADYDTGINGALGLPTGMYHFAFKVASLDELEVLRSKLLSHGLDASPIIDLGTAKSVFLADPNNIQVELCCHVRPFGEADLHQESEASVALPDQ
jgi:catechol 2,3-dioxygenase-like lactoylglutathione lyase family enzyme